MLTATGQAGCWGLNSSGQLGNPVTGKNSLVPAPVTSSPSYIGAGISHSCMLRNGLAFCWGNNGSGQLGNNSTTSSSVPVAVYTGGALSGVTLMQITAGQSFTCALSTAGAVYCWGRNVYGQLGNGTTTQSNVPVAVSTSGVLSGVTVTQVTAGDEGACALSSAGAAYCWGFDSYGQLGNGTAARRRRLRSRCPRPGCCPGSP